MKTTVDIARRDAIVRYDIVGKPAEPDLIGLVELAASICGVPTAVINIIDDQFQHQIASIGIEADICSREDSMCAAVLHHAKHVAVEDAREDERFSSNPFVTGEIAHVRFYASSPVITPEGIPIGTLCVFDEETKELSAEQSRSLDLLAQQVVDVLELLRKSAELERSNDQLAHFASQVSHDLRNPLTALAGFLELAAEDPGLESAPLASESIERAGSVATRMTAMVVDLLNYARAEGAKPRREEVPLDGLVRSVVEDLDAAVESTGATVTVDAPCTLVGDPTLLRALVQNLVANAIKFASAAGTTPRVEITGTDTATGWRVTIDDNGPGVPVEERERVFELMERGSAEGAPGLGIGLSTCRRIVTGHGGSIGIDESPLGGARVWFELPAAWATDAPATLIA